MKINGMPQSAPPDQSADSRSRLQTFESHKKQLNIQLERVQKDKYMSNEVKEKKIKTLKNEIKKVDRQIQELSGKSANSEDQDNANSILNDSLPKKPVEFVHDAKSEDSPGLYRVLRESGSEAKIFFHKPNKRS